MDIRNRDLSLELISDRVSHEQLKKAVTQNYSDVSLSFMAGLKGEFVAEILDSKTSVSTVNKLTSACLSEKISYDNFFHIVKYCGNKNEPYINDFLDSIDNGFHHETAAKTFAAVLYENCSYKEAIEYVKSGAFYPTEYASLSVTNEVAEQLDKMGIPLRACEGFNNCYDIDSADRLEGALERGAAIFVRDKNLAVKVCEYMKLPDWSNFRSQVELAMGTEIVCLSGDTLSGLRDKYLHENRCIALSQKVNGEYSKFIADMKKEPADVIIESAYEIVSKDNIAMYCQEYNIELSEKQFAALMSSKNTLDEVYREWCDNGEWHGIDDIGLALEETADRIQISLDRNISEQKAEPVPEQKQAVKPKNKAR